MADLSTNLCAVAKVLKANFTFDGKPLTYEDVFAANGLLPGLVKRADQLASLCLGYGLGATYEDDENAPLKIKVNFDDITPDIIRYFCIVDVLSELIQSGPVRDKTPLDELRYF
jgi:intracellular multiplication protein IcmS